MKTALATTCFREAEAIEAFIDAVTGQTRKPDEIVIVDAGSDDGTVEQIQRRIAAGAPVTLVVAPGAGRSAGRNRAIEVSSAELIALTDVGSHPRPDWFERIIAPLEADDEVGVVAGYYEAEPKMLWQAAVAAATVPAAAEVDPGTFLPSGRSVAFRRSAWQRVGGYPEWAEYGEDTAFGLALRRHGAVFRFEPQAVVRWNPESRLGRLARQFYRYARGDAQARQWFRHYTKAYTLAVLKLGMLVGGAFWWPAWLGIPALAALYWVRHALRARRRTSRAAAAWLAPLANAAVDAAHVAGYTRGLLERQTNGLGDR